MKYIINKNRDLLIFSDGMAHVDMAFRFGDVVGAGFITSGLKVYGRSVSLNIDSRGEEDQEIVDRHFQIDK